MFSLRRYREEIELYRKLVKSESDGGEKKRCPREIPSSIYLHLDAPLLTPDSTALH